MPSITSLTPPSARADVTRGLDRGDVLMYRAAVMILLVPVLLFSLLPPQLRPPSTLRAPAAPPDEGTGTFQEHTYTFRRDSRQFLLEYTPALPRRAVVLAAMKEACQHLYDLDFSKSTPRPGPAPDEWLVELKDARICYVRQGPSAPTGEVKTLRVWMP